MKRIPLVLCLALLALAPVGLRAHADEEAAVRAAVARLFDGMRAGDSTAVRAAFLPGARLQTAAVRRDGTVELATDSLDAFVRAVGTPHDAVWDERVANVQVRVDGPLAAATMDYAFYAGERFSHCGINALQLFRSPDGWKIFQITDTRRRTGCPDPNESRP